MRGIGGRFLFVGVAWAVVGLFFCFWPQNHGLMAVMWFLGFWAISMLDLLALAKALHLVIRMAANSEANAQLNGIPKLFFWGSLKLVCLGLFILLLLASRDVPGIIPVLGVGTVLVVPLGGGLIGGLREIKYA